MINHPFYKECSKYIKTSFYLYGVQLSNQNQNMECLKQYYINYNQKQNCGNKMNNSPKKTQNALESGINNNRRDRQIFTSLPHRNNTNEEYDPSLPSALPHKLLKQHQNNPEKLPTIYRKHEYDGQQFTQIYNMKTATSQIRTKSIIKYTLADFNQIVTYDSLLVNVSEIDSSNTYKKTQWKQLLNSDKNCNCSHNQCMQNYCTCFKQGKKCDLDCLCLDCLNYRSQQLHRDQSLSKPGSKQRKKTQINQLEPKKTQNKLSINQSVRNDNSMRCNCRKSGGCLLKYCGCRRLGINCSILCFCTNCKN